MYDELIAELRQHHCDAKEDDTQEVCEECSYDVIIVDKSAPSGIASVCVCGLMNRAADAIEKLSKRVPVPPHGRLIDADKMVESVKAQVDLLRMMSLADPTLKEIADIIEKGYLQEIANAPTIIPAEPAEEGE